MTSVVYRIGRFPASDDLATELLDRILVALVLDHEVSVLLYGDGLRWLQQPENAGPSDQIRLSRFKLLKLYGLDRLHVVPAERHATLLQGHPLFALERIELSQTASLLRQHSLVL